MTNHEISCLEQGERNERFWTFGPSSSARHAKEGRPPATNYTPPPPPPPPHKSLGTQRELMAKISGKSQNIIKWCKNMWQYIIYFVTLEMGKLTGQKLKPRHFLLFYPGFTVVGLICWGIRFSNTVFSFQNKQESQLTKQNNEISCSNIFS